MDLGTLLTSWHSTRVGETVYHNNRACTEGNNIESYYLSWGTGGKRLCSRCASLNSSKTLSALYTSIR
jgi:hypothetical protein